MIIHSIVPAEFIEDQGQPPQSKCVKCEYGFVQVVKGAEGWAVNRLISTNPADYLNPQYSPGTKFDMQ